MLDEIVNLASSFMIERIAQKSGLPMSEVTMFMSMLAQLEVCQVVNPLKTARLSVTKWFLKDIGVNLIEK